VVRRSAVLGLPEDVREQLEDRLVGSAFSNYVGLAEWLESQGYKISKSSLHRYGSDFQSSLEGLHIATKQAQAIVQSSPDDEGVMAESLLRLMQSKIFSAVVGLSQDELSGSVLSRLARAAADVSRADLSNRKYQQEIRERAAAAAAAVDRQLQGQKGLSPELAASIRAEILGIPL